MSINWQNDANPRPAILVLPPGAASLDEAHAAIELWEHYARKTLDPTQRLTVEVMMAQTANERWAAVTTGREMARQNGKGEEVEVVELWGLVQRSEAIMHTVHDAVLLASQTQQRMLGILEGHADLRRRVLRRWLGTGQQMIEMRNGGIIWYRTRTGGGGRGVDDIDRLVVDEAQHAAEEHLAALTPTLFSNDNPQMNVLGTAGIQGKSDWWWSLRLRALTPDPGAFGYVGHTAETVSVREGRVIQPPVDVEDRGLWMDANPALHTGRGQGKEFFEEQLRRLGPSSFAREHLCVWDPPPNSDAMWIVVPEVYWRACESVGHEPTKILRYALDVDQNARGEQWASIACSDGTHLEIATPPDAGPGTAWVVAACVAKKLVIAELVVAGDGPASALIPELEAAGIKIRKVTPEEFAGASMQMFDAVLQTTVRHLDQPALNVAVAGVQRRDVGDGKWRWSRKLSTVDIGPLCAVTLARWAAVALPAPQEPLVAWR